MGTSYRARRNVVAEIKSRDAVVDEIVAELFLPEGTELPKNITALREAIDMTGELAYFPGQYLVLGNGKAVSWAGDDWVKHEDTEA